MRKAPLEAKDRSVCEFMTPAPWTIGPTQTLAGARRLMREHHIRHLPVLSGGQLLGILSERDIALVEAMPGVNPTVVQVDETMSQDVFTVTPEAALGEVARTMAERKLGSAVVVDGERVAGVFTTIDALRALAQ